MLRSPGKRLILNVDDDEAGRYAVSRVLKQANFDVLEAANGADGLRLAAEHSPDLVLLDVRLPDIDGFEVCRRLKLKQETQTIPVVHMTASFLDSTFQARGLEGGADAYLLEPVDPAVLIASVNSMLRIRDAERDVRNYANAWQSTFDSMREGIAVLDSDATIVQANRSFRELFPESSRQVAGIPGPSSHFSLNEVVRSVEKSGRHAKWEMTRERSTFAISLDPIQTPSGKQGVICVVRDVTERNQLEENLRFTQKLEGVGLLAGGIAHDFNNLLTGILGNASLALDAYELPLSLRPMLQEVVVASERAAGLTRQLLAYAGKGRFFEEPMDLSKMVRETLQLVHSNLVMANVKLNLDRSLPPILADTTQIQQLLMNMIINASEAIGPKGGSISITTQVVKLDASEAATGFPNYSLDPGPYVSVAIEDSGVGMDASTLDRIFDPFFTTKFFGRGLGLSATLGIVQGHRGAIRVSSKVGQGSRFQVVFPVSTVPEVRLSPAAPVHAVRPAAILVIEDEDSVSRMMKLALEADGHSVCIAGNGRDGLRMFESNTKFDLVTVDLTMPVMDGEETIQALQSVDPNVRIVVCTGHAESEAAKLGRLGIAGVIVKPFAGSALKSEVRKYLSDATAL
jgi:two-component system, cell cycle sensor histidine kinase and response regulator CckA